MNSRQCITKTSCTQGSLYWRQPITRSEKTLSQKLRQPASPQDFSLGACDVLTSCVPLLTMMDHCICITIKPIRTHNASQVHALTLMPLLLHVLLFKITFVCHHLAHQWQMHWYVEWLWPLEQMVTPAFSSSGHSNIFIPELERNTMCRCGSLVMVMLVFLYDKQTKQ